MYCIIFKAKLFAYKIIFRVEKKVWRTKGLKDIMGIFVISIILLWRILVLLLHYQIWITYLIINY